MQKTDQDEECLTPPDVAATIEAVLESNAVEAAVEHAEYIATQGALEAVADTVVEQSVDIAIEENTGIDVQQIAQQIEQTTGEEVTEEQVTAAIESISGGSTAADIASTFENVEANQVIDLVTQELEIQETQQQQEIVTAVEQAVGASTVEIAQQIEQATGEQVTNEQVQEAIETLTEGQSADEATEQAEGLSPGQILQAVTAIVVEQSEEERHEEVSVAVEASLGATAEQIAADIQRETGEEVTAAQVEAALPAVVEDDATPQDAVQQVEGLSYTDVLQTVAETIEQNVEHQEAVLNVIEETVGISTQEIAQQIEQSTGEEVTEEQVQEAIAVITEGATVKEAEQAAEEVTPGQVIADVIEVIEQQAQESDHEEPWSDVGLPEPAQPGPQVDIEYLENPGNAEQVTEAVDSVIPTDVVIDIVEQNTGVELSTQEVIEAVAQATASESTGDAVDAVENLNGNDIINIVTAVVEQQTEEPAALPLPEPESQPGPGPEPQVDTGYLENPNNAEQVTEAVDNVIPAEVVIQAVEQNTGVELSTEEVIQVVAQATASESTGDAVDAVENLSGNDIINIVTAVVEGEAQPGPGPQPEPESQPGPGPEPQVDTGYLENPSNAEQVAEAVDNVIPTEVIIQAVEQNTGVELSAQEVIEAVAQATASESTGDAVDAVENLNGGDIINIVTAVVEQQTEEPARPLPEPESQPGPGPEPQVDTGYLENSDNADEVTEAVDSVIPTDVVINIVEQNTGVELSTEEVIQVVAQATASESTGDAVDAVEDLSGNDIINIVTAAVEGEAQPGPGPQPELGPEAQVDTGYLEDSDNADEVTEAVDNVIPTDVVVAIIEQNTGVEVSTQDVIQAVAEATASESTGDAVDAVENLSGNDIINIVTASVEGDAQVGGQIQLDYNPEEGSQQVNDIIYGEPQPGPESDHENDECLTHVEVAQTVDQVLESPVVQQAVEAAQEAATQGAVEAITATVVEQEVDTTLEATTGVSVEQITQQIEQTTGEQVTEADVVAAIEAASGSANPEVIAATVEDLTHQEVLDLVTEHVEQEQQAVVSVVENAAEGSTEDIAQQIENVTGQEVTTEQVEAAIATIVEGASADEVAQETNNLTSDQVIETIATTIEAQVEGDIEVHEAVDSVTPTETVIEIVEQTTGQQVTTEDVINAVTEATGAESSEQAAAIVENLSEGEIISIVTEHVEQQAQVEAQIEVTEAVDTVVPTDVVINAVEQTTGAEITTQDVVIAVAEATGAESSEQAAAIVETLTPEQVINIVTEHVETQQEEGGYSQEPQGPAEEPQGPQGESGPQEGPQGPPQGPPEEPQGPQGESGPEGPPQGPPEEPAGQQVIYGGPVDECVTPGQVAEAVEHAIEVTQAIDEVVPTEVVANAVAENTGEQISTETVIEAVAQATGAESAEHAVEIIENLTPGEVIDIVTEQVEGGQVQTEGPAEPQVDTGYLENPSNAQEVTEAVDAVVPTEVVIDTVQEATGQEVTTQDVIEAVAQATGAESVEQVTDIIENLTPGEVIDIVTEQVKPDECLTNVEVHEAIQEVLESPQVAEVVAAVEEVATAGAVEAIEDAVEEQQQEEPSGAFGFLIQMKNKFLGI